MYVRLWWRSVVGKAWVSLCLKVSIIMFQSVNALLAKHVLSGISPSIHCTVCVYTICSQDLFNIDGMITIVRVSSQIF